MEILADWNMLLTIQGKQQSLFIYQLDNLRAHINSTFQNKPNDLTGMRLPGCKNSRYFAANRDDPNRPFVIAACAKLYVMYTYSLLTKMLKKSGEFELSNEAWTPTSPTYITFIGSHVIVSHGSTFYLWYPASGRIEGNLRKSE